MVHMLELDSDRRMGRSMYRTANIHSLEIVARYYMVVVVSVVEEVAVHVCEEHRQGVDSIASANVHFRLCIYVHG